MDKKTTYIMLYEAYNKMLTTHMCTIFEQYYFSDLSYREIADNKGITYQAVRDTLKKTEKQLEDYEDKLQLVYIKSKVNELDTLLNHKKLSENVINEMKNIVSEIEVL